eukprot:g8775.t1
MLSRRLGLSPHRAYARSRLFHNLIRTTQRPPGYVAHNISRDPGLVDCTVDMCVDKSSISTVDTNADTSELNSNQIPPRLEIGQKQVPQGNSNPQALRRSSVNVESTFDLLAIPVTGFNCFNLNDRPTSQSLSLDLSNRRPLISSSPNAARRVSFGITRVSSNSPLSRLSIPPETSRTGTMADKRPAIPTFHQ